MLNADLSKQVVHLLNQLYDGFCHPRQIVPLGLITPWNFTLIFFYYHDKQVIATSGLQLT